MKLIYIDTPRFDLSSEYTNTLNNDDFEFSIRDCFSTRFAAAFKEYQKKSDIEVWTSYNPRVWGNRGIVQHKKNGLVHVSFPHLEFGQWGVIYSMQKKLKKMINAGNNFLVILQNLHSYNNYLIIRALKKIPLIVQQRSHIPPAYKNSPFFDEYSSKVRRSGTSLYEQKIFRNIDYSFCNGILSKQHISSIIGPQKTELRHNTGYYFDQVKRTKEKFNSDKVRIMGIVRFSALRSRRSKDGLKGVRQMLIAYRKLSQKIDCELTLFGKLPEKNDSFGNMLHKIAGRLNVKSPGRVPHKSLISHMCNTDIHWTFVPGIWKYFGGVSTSSIESMAHNIPQINNALINFQGKDFQDIGFAPRKTNDIVESTLEVINNNSRFKNVRNSSKHVYDWKILTDNHYRKYKEIYELYF